MRSRSLGWRLAVAGVALVLMGHSPYRQWLVFRESHLVIVADDTAAGAFAVSDAVAHALAARMPRSKAVAASAGSALGVAKLLRSRQLPLAVLLAADAADAFHGSGRFSREPLRELRTLAVLGPYLLVALDDLPAQAAREIVAAVSGHAPEDLPMPAPDAPAIPFHPALAAAGPQLGRPGAGG